MSAKQTVFTIKIFGEGLTEWFYFDRLRSLEKFSFSLQPGFPAKSRSSFQKRLPLIDKELRRRSEERPDMLVLITDLDNIVSNPSELRKYHDAKQKYSAKGVIFIESHPSIELWFLYHFKPRFEKSTYATYDEIKAPLRTYLPDYEKSKDYYTRNTIFRDNILVSRPQRSSAATCAHGSCRYPAADGETVNHTNIHELILFLHMLQFRYMLADILRARIHESFSLDHSMEGLSKIRLSSEGILLCTLKAGRDGIVCHAEGISADIPLGLRYQDCNENIRQLFDILETSLQTILYQKKSV